MSDPVKLVYERQRTHGVWEEQAATAQALKDELRKAPKYSDLRPQQREALDLIMVKASRIVNGDGTFKDHWDDVSGYAKLGAGDCDHSSKT